MRQTGKYFPLFVSLTGKQVYIVGAGKVAARRAEVLLSFGARLFVVAPKCTPELLGLLKKKNGENLVYQKKSFEEADLIGKDIVLAATNDEELNHRIAVLCREKGVPVNNASRKEDCDFFFPAILQEQGLTIGVSSGGGDHKKVARVCEKLRCFFGDVVVLRPG